MKIDILSCLLMLAQMFVQIQLKKEKSTKSYN